MSAPSPGRLDCRVLAAVLSLVVVAVLLAISVRDPVPGGKLVDEDNVSAPR